MKPFKSPASKLCKNYLHTLLWLALFICILLSSAVVMHLHYRNRYFDSARHIKNDQQWQTSTLII